MTYQDLVKRSLAFEQELANHARYYRLGDKHVVCVEVPGMGRVRRSDPLDLVVTFHVLEHIPADENGGEGFDGVDLDDLPVAALVRYAEIKAMIESWKVGALAELPPSTSDIPAHRKWFGRRLRRR